MNFRISALSLSYVVLVLLFPNKSAAVPSYSRQTGLSCASCHYAPPELNAFGRKFKLEGYTFATKPEVSEAIHDVERSFVPGGYALSLRTHWRIAAESRNRIRIQRARHRSLLAPRVAELHCEQQL